MKKKLLALSMVLCLLLGMIPNTTVALAIGDYPNGMTEEEWQQHIKDMEEANREANEREQKIREYGERLIEWQKANPTATGKPPFYDEYAYLFENEKSDEEQDQEASDYINRNFGMNDATDGRVNTKEREKEVNATYSTEKVSNADWENNQYRKRATMVRSYGLYRKKKSNVDPYVEGESFNPQKHKCLPYIKIALDEWKVQYKGRNLCDLYGDYCDMIYSDVNADSLEYDKRPLTKDDTYVEVKVHLFSDKHKMHSYHEYRKDYYDHLNNVGFGINGFYGGYPWHYVDTSLYSKESPVGEILNNEFYVTAGYFKQKLDSDKKYGKNDKVITDDVKQYLIKKGVPETITVKVPVTVVGKDAPDKVKHPAYLPKLQGVYMAEHYYNDYARPKAYWTYQKKLYKKYKWKADALYSSENDHKVNPFYLKQKKFKATRKRAYMPVFKISCPYKVEWQLARNKTFTDIKLYQQIGVHVPQDGDKKAIKMHEKLLGQKLWDVGTYKTVIADGLGWLPWNLVKKAYKGTTKKGKGIENLIYMDRFADDSEGQSIPVVGTNYLRLRSVRKVNGKEIKSKWVVYKLKFPKSDKEEWDLGWVNAYKLNQEIGIDEDTYTMLFEKDELGYGRNWQEYYLNAGSNHDQAPEWQMPYQASLYPTLVPDTGLLHFYE